MDRTDFSDDLSGDIGFEYYKGMVGDARKAVAEHDLQLDRIKSAFLAAYEEADRSAAILLFALAEDLMLGCFKQHFNQNVAGGWKAITEGNGVIATASDRIALLELLHWIRPSTGADLRLMKSIRNRFAHHADVHSFNDKTVRGWISTMSGLKGSILHLANVEYEKPDARGLYLARAISTLITLTQELAIGPTSRMAQVDPEDVTPTEVAEHPQNMLDALSLHAQR